MFMRCINEPIARQANGENHNTGACWEGRFKSHALLDEQAFLAAMVYVELNPVRAQMADTPEESEHTSIKQRIEHGRDGTIPQCLMRFQGHEHRDNLNGTPFALEHYVELVDWTGRTTRRNKRGAIDSRLPPILNHLGIAEDTWLIISPEFEQSFRQWVSSAEAIQRATQNIWKTRSLSPPIRAP